MNSATLVAKKMRDITISDSKFLKSSYFLSYLRTMLSPVCKAAKLRVPKIVVKPPVENDFAAYTDGTEIVLNPEHRMVRKLRNRSAKARCMIGMVTHEYGHVRLTSFSDMTSGVNAISRGQFFPKLKASLPDDIEENADDFARFVEENPKRINSVTTVWHDLHNICEDAFIEEMLYYCVSGLLIDGLNFNRRNQLREIPTIAQLLEAIAAGRVNLWAAVRDTVFIYAKFGLVRVDWRDKALTSSDLMRWVKTCMPVVDKTIHQKSSRKRTEGVNLLFLTLWPLIQEYILTLPEDEEAESGEYSAIYKGTGERADKSHGADGLGEEDDDDKTSSEKARAKTRKAAEGSDGGDDSDEKDSTGSETSGDSLSEADDKDGPPGGAHPKEAEAGTVEDIEGDGSIDTVETEEDLGDDFEEELRAEMDRLEREMKEDIATEEVNVELTEDLRKEASDIDFGSSHRGLKVDIERVSKVSERTKEVVDSSIAPVEAIADTMVRKVLPLIKKNNNVDNIGMTGFFSGSKFDATRLVLNDCRYFRQNVTPPPDKRLALSVLIDESGSMHGERIEVAKIAALALYLFAEKARIPVSVIGHTADTPRVGYLNLVAYADYESPDRDDRYRIMSISAKNQNRDGAAILYAGEHLLKRPEPTKLMIIVSDGVPCSGGYYGTAANTDTANIVSELRRRGLTIFTAAIGDDKTAIRQIFGEGFIDITSLATLPDQLLGLVKRYVR